MMDRRLKSFIAELLIGILFISSSACGNKKEPINTDNFWYDCSSFSIPAAKGYSQSVCDTMYADGYYYTTLQSSKINEKETGEEVCYNLYKFDSDGNCLNKVALPTISGSHGIIVNEKLHCTSPDATTEYVIDINTGNIISEETANDYIYGFYSSNDDYVKLTASRCICYSLDGTEIGRAEINGFSAFYQSEGSYYLVEENGNKLFFRELIFGNNKKNNVIEIDLKSFVDIEINKNAIFTDDGVYRLDIKSKSLLPITEWNYVNVKPAYKSTLYETNTSFGHERFGKIYTYNDNEIEVILFNKIPAADNKDRKTITIGGYGVNYSLAVKWAVYRFNTSQNEYRVFLDDYWHKYSYETGVEAQAQIAKLIKYFKEGNAPDIYFGTNFDYRYMYNAGLVIDMNG